MDASVAVVGSRNHATSVPVASSRRAINWSNISGRLVIVAGSAALAVPAAIQQLTSADLRSWQSQAIAVTAVLCCGLLVATRLRPRPGEPAVHDRQVDVILSLPFLAAAVWVGLHNHGAPQWTGYDAIALTSFLGGTGFLVLGTRATGRLVLPLLMPLLTAPLITSHRAVLVVALAVLVVVAVRGLRGRAGRDVRRATQPHDFPAWGSSMLPVVLALGVLLVVGWHHESAGPAPIVGSTQSR